MPKPIAHAQVCSTHQCLVTCVGDEEQGLLLSGTCPMGGETITVDMSSSLNAPAPGTVRATGVGGVHDPMATVARGVPTPTLNSPQDVTAETDAVDGIDPTTGLPVESTTGVKEPAIVETDPSVAAETGAAIDEPAFVERDPLGTPINAPAEVAAESTMRSGE